MRTDLPSKPAAVPVLLLNNLHQSTFLQCFLNLKETMPISNLKDDDANVLSKFV